MTFRTTLLLLTVTSSTKAFTVLLPCANQQRGMGMSSLTRVQGYLDDLSKDLYAPDATPDIVAESKEMTDMSKEKIDRFGPSDFSQFVDFHEFDGGDGRT
jgi:hypothetical protein